MEIKKSISSTMACSMANLSLPININILSKYNILGGPGGSNVLGVPSRSSGPCGIGVSSGPSSLVSEDPESWLA